MITIYFGRHYVKANEENVRWGEKYVEVSGNVELDGERKNVKSLTIPWTSIAYILEE